MKILFFLSSVYALTVDMIQSDCPSHSIVIQQHINSVYANYISHSTIRFKRQCFSYLIFDTFENQTYPTPIPSHIPQ